MAIQTLPSWLKWGGGILAFSAGSVNSTALIGFTHLAVSNVTGNVTLFSTAIVQHNWHDLWVVTAILLSFLAGAILSGFIVQQQPLTLSRRYGLALAIEAMLLYGSIFSYQQGWLLGEMLAAMACGLQNAMVTTYSGAVIRTTHLTGLTSDLGAALGNWLAGRCVNKASIAFQVIIWYCYCGGGVIGAMLFLKFHYWALILPACIVTLSAIAYYVLSHKNKFRK